MKSNKINAHHLRELTYAEEEEGQAWAKDMSATLKSLMFVIFFVITLWSLI